MAHGKTAQATLDLMLQSGWAVDTRLLADDGKPYPGHFVKTQGDTRLFLKSSILDKLESRTTSLSVHKSSTRLDHLARQIWQEDLAAAITGFRNFSATSAPGPVAGHRALTDLLTEAEAWATAEPLSSIIARACLDRPDIDTVKQRLHLVCLAAKGDWLTLGDYKDQVARGNRLNFQPPPLGPSAQAIERAYDLALEVAFPEQP